MSSALSAKDEILQRIRTALPGEPVDVARSYGRIVRGYETTAAMSGEERIELFRDRLIDYDAKIYDVTDASQIADAVEQALLGADENHLLVPMDFPEAWVPKGVAVERDAALTTAQIEAAEAVLTTCEVAVASTGTIFLVHEGAQGRRVLTLLPDHHVCVVKRSQVVATIPEAMRLVDAKMGKPITTISGPSATSDIEMTRIRGVHGPRRLTVILCG